jgi:hypothetical protein
MECDRALRERTETGVHRATARADRGDRLGQVRVTLSVVRRQIPNGVTVVGERQCGDSAGVRDGFGDVVLPCVVCVRPVREETGEQPRARPPRILGGVPADGSFGVGCEFGEESWNPLGQPG